ncbi:MAG: hypothetical protein ACE1ZM_01755 [Gammaproteobacteria bacterium]
MVLSSNRTTLLANGNETAVLTAQLILPDDEGIVSENTRVIFRAELASTGTSIRELQRESLSNASGNAITSLFGRTMGLMRIIGTVDNLPSVADTLFIEFQ